MNGVTAYALAKSYTNTVIEGLGPLKGSPCEIQSIVEITGGHRVTFKWTSSSGTTETGSFDIMDGESPAVSAEEGNAIQIKGDGWYVANVQGVQISQAEGNIITMKSDGLYAAGSGTIVIDSALSMTSENPAQNKVITSAINNKLNISDFDTAVGQNQATEVQIASLF